MLGICNFFRIGVEGEKLLLGKQSMAMSNDWDLPDTCRHSRHLLAPHLLGAASMNIWDFRATFFFFFFLAFGAGMSIIPLR